MEIINAQEAGKLEYSAAVIRGLLNYHDRMMLALKEDQKCEACSVTIGADSYREALTVALTLIEEKLRDGFV